MKVLHILAQLPMKTGSGVYFTNLVEGLKSFSDIEQACIYGTTKDYEINILEKNRQFEVIFESEKLPFPIAGMSDVMPYNNTIYSQMSEDMISIWKENFYEQLHKAKKEFNPDIVITHHLWILSSMVWEVFEDKKIFAICHNTDIRQAEQHVEMKEKYVTNINKIDKILALSDNQIGEISRVYNYNPENIINLGAGYNDKIFYPLEKYEDKSVIEFVYAGKFDESKGFYELIKAFNKMNEQYENITLDLIGAVNENNKEKINKTVAGNVNIKIYNVANQKELADVLRTKDIFVLPSYFEGLGLIAVEALGSGLRAVTTNIEGLIEFLGDDINNSGVIEYVDMPTIYDTDKAVEAEKPAFINRLVKTMLVQKERVEKNRPLPSEIFSRIEEHSWKEKIKYLYKIINK